MTWFSGGSFQAEPRHFCDDPAHVDGCPCHAGGDAIYRRVRVSAPDSYYHGLQGELRTVNEESGTRLVRLDGWTLDLPFGESELESER